ncbi:hypothetical protein C2E23DRAFT_593060 [Lenzites betulinus]|nr:hypothetical protein C2E23DRAFT_593060 [Lenzites betulinus]
MSASSSTRPTVRIAATQQLRAPCSRPTEPARRSCARVRRPAYLQRPSPSPKSPPCADPAEGRTLHPSDPFLRILPRTVPGILHVL